MVLLTQDFLYQLLITILFLIFCHIFSFHSLLMSYNFLRLKSADHFFQNCVTYFLKALACHWKEMTVTERHFQESIFTVYRNSKNTWCKNFCFRNTFLKEQSFFMRTSKTLMMLNVLVFWWFSVLKCSFYVLTLMLLLERKLKLSLKNILMLNLRSAKLYTPVGHPVTLKTMTSTVLESFFCNNFFSKYNSSLFWFFLFKLRSLKMSLIFFYFLPISASFFS